MNPTPPTTLTAVLFVTRAQYDLLVTWRPEYMRERWTADFPSRIWGVNSVRLEGPEAAIHLLRDQLAEIERQIEADREVCDWLESLL